MKKYFSLLIIGLFLTGCTTSQVENRKNKIPTDNQSQTYHEIETTLTSETVDDIVDFSSVVPKEISKLQEKGEIFWHDQNHKIQERAPMYYLQSKIECKNGGKEDCSIVGLQAYKNNLPPEFTVVECGSDDWCLITEPKFQKDLTNNIKQIAGFYGFGKDIYTIGSMKGDDNYSIYMSAAKNPAACCGDAELAPVRAHTLCNSL